MFKKKHCILLGDLSKVDLTEGIMKSAERFICGAYRIPDVETWDEARVRLSWHAARFPRHAHSLSSKWLEPRPLSLRASSMCDRYDLDLHGWPDGTPLALSLQPILKADSEIISCGCSKECISMHSSSRKVKQSCREICKCAEQYDPCGSLRVWAFNSG